MRTRPPARAPRTPALAGIVHILTASSVSCRRATAAANAAPIAAIAAAVLATATAAATAAPIAAIAAPIAAIAAAILATAAAAGRRHAFSFTPQPHPKTPLYSI